MEVYIDDMVVKSVDAENHVLDLQEVFDILRKVSWTHGDEESIEASPEQIKPIFELKSPSNVKDVQKLIGKVASLNKFISRSSNRCKLFYDVLRKNKGFLWTDKHKASLNNLKSYLTTPPLLSKTIQGEDLFVYLYVTDHAVSGVLVKESEADALAGLGAVSKGLDLNNIPVVHIIKPAIERLVHHIEMMALDQYDDNISKDVDRWIKVYKDYLQLGIKPDNNNEARILRMKASRFTVIDDELFKKFSKGLLQRCLRKYEVDMVLRYAHKGEYGNHTNERNISLKILHLGYYWLMLRHDALDYTRRCDVFQRHAPGIHQPSEHLNMSIPSWLFMKWGMDILGKMPHAPVQKVFMLAMTDYFSK
ncbi:uncharacterized protein LOC141679449 [Apium graveolens]|uniref:uncharacterized protein LOC141679449 n=1 Tax=Apium graveolens TaxID=4045 RepID=UPI003D78B8DC